MAITLGCLNATFHSTDLTCRCDICDYGHVTTKFFHIGLKFLWQWRLEVTRARERRYDHACFVF